MNKKTLKDYILKPVMIAGLAAGLYSCTEAKAQEHDPYEFRRIGTKIEIPDCKETYNEVMSITTADLDGDGRPEVIVGTEHCGVYIFKNSVPQKQIGGYRR